MWPLLWKTSVLLWKTSVFLKHSFVSPAKVGTCRTCSAKPISTMIKRQQGAGDRRLAESAAIVGRLMKPGFRLKLKGFQGFG